jgi:hypothetical protein
MSSECYVLKVSLLKFDIGGHNIQYLFSRLALTGNAITFV